MYAADITFKDETGYEETFPTLQEAVNFIQHWATGGRRCRAWINNKEVRLRNGYVVDEAGEAFCTNEKWHEIFANPSQKVSPLSETDLLKRMHVQMDRIFRPQSTRGCSPTNPATRAAKGEV